MFSWSWLVCIGLSLSMLFVVDMVAYTLKRRGWSRFICTFLLFWSQIIVTEFMLGLFSVLTSPSLVVINLLLSAGLLVFIHKKFGKKIYKKYFGDWRRSVTNTWQLLRSDPLWSVLVLLAVLFLTWVIFLGIIFPVTDFDGNSYHLTFIGNIIQNHNFFDVPTSLPWLTGYPKGGEFMQMWSLLITHSDFLVDLTQVPFLLLGVYALYEVSVRLGADKKQARFSALLFLFLPIVLNQLKTTYVDVMVCSLFFAGLAVVIKEKLQRLDFVLLGIIFSLVIAVKSTGLLFVIALLPLLIWRLYEHSKKSKKFMQNYVEPLLLVIAPTAFGLYWYFKDLFLYHTPIYPFGFKLLGKSIFPGRTFQEFAASAINSLKDLPHGYLERIWFVWTEQKDWFGCLYNYDTNYAGLGPIWFIVLLPAIFTGLYFAIKQRRYLFLAVTGTILALFVIYPSDYYSRYTMFIASIGIFGLSLTLSNINRLVGNLVKAFSIVLVLAVIATNFALCNFPPGVVKSQLKRFIHGSERSGLDANVGHAFVFFEQTTQPGEVVTYDSSPYFIYPLWRPDFLNKVIYVKASDKSDWYKQLSNDHVKYAFTTIGSKENGWAKTTLKRIYKDDMYEIYQAY